MVRSQNLRSVFRVLSLLLVFGGLDACPARAQPQSARQAAQRASLIRQYETAVAGHQTRLNELVQWSHDRQFAEGLSIVEAAAQRTAVAGDSDAGGHDLPRMARVEIPERPGDSENLLLRLIREAEQETANELYRLSRQMLRSGFPTLAFEVIDRLLKFDPDHRNARAVLKYRLFRDPLRSGQVDYAGEWVTQFEAEMRSGSDPKVWVDQYGWIPTSHVAHYEVGERFWRGKWISQEKESELRRDFRNAWEIRTENFLVKTNHSQERGVEIASQLERFHQYLHRSLAAFFETPDALAQRFTEASTSRGRSLAKKPLEVHYYATKQEYDERMRGRIPPGITTNGLYWQPDQTCYFFYNPERLEDSTTLFHEATHQILDVHTADARIRAARARAARDRRYRNQPWILCENANFWIIEGLACYYESFEIDGDEIRVGNPEFIRFQAARQRVLEDNFYVPIHEFTSLGKEAFQNDPRIYPMYSQGSGFAHFLMHYDGGRYRDRLTNFLLQLYSPELSALGTEPSLMRTLGSPGHELDREYKLHMETLPKTAIIERAIPGATDDETRSVPRGARQERQ